MNSKRKNILLALLGGLTLAIVFTLAATLALAACLLWIQFGDPLLTALNQLIKISAAALGTCAAVKRGGRRGFATGACLGLAYASLGCIASRAAGALLTAANVPGEMMICAAAGAVTGAVRANLPPRSRRSPARNRTHV